MAYATDRLAEELGIVSPSEVFTASSAVLDAITDLAGLGQRLRLVLSNEYEPAA